MILMREITPATIRFGIVVVSWSTPSTRWRTRISPPSFSKCTSEAPVLDRLGDDRVDELDDRRVVGGLADVADVGELLVLVLLDRLGHGVVEAVHAPDQGGHVLVRGHDRPHLLAGHQLEVVEREDVRGVDHRHQQRARLVDPDRHGVEALARAWALIRFRALRSAL